MRNSNFTILRTILRLISFLFALGVLVVGVAVVWFISLVPQLPEISSVQELQLKVPLRIYSSDGLLMAEYGDERRTPVKIEQAPEKLIHAVLAAEDDQFYKHAGVDFKGFTRAAIENLKAGTITQGASTITMQVARNFFLSRERTYVRKAKEVLLAFQLEQHLTKDEILELYLNKIFLGHRAYGFGAAAKIYYGKDLAELTLAQHAMLAALPKSPSRVNPLSHPQVAQERRDYILDRMLTLNFVSAEEHGLAKSTPLTAESHVAEVELNAPYIAEHVRQQVINIYGNAAYEDGYEVYTTVHSKNQLAARESLRSGLISYDERHGFRGPVRNWNLKDLLTDESRIDALKQLPTSGDLLPVLVTTIEENEVIAFTRKGELISIPWEQMKWARFHKDSRSLGPEPKSPKELVNLGDIVYARPVDETWRLSQIPAIEGALVAVRPSDGAIQAMVGGFDYFLGKFNRSTQAVRQLGSTIKPFIYSAAFASGFTPASVVSAAPVVVEDTSTNIVWRPENYSGKFFGPTRLRSALSRSLNLVSVRLMRSMGWEYTADYLEGFGFDKAALPNGLSLALGSAAFTPLEVVSGYAVFANGGYAVEPYIIDVIKNQHGKVMTRGRKSVVCNTCVPKSGSEDDAGQDGEAESMEDQFAERVISPENAYLMQSVLRDVVASGTAKKAQELKRSDLGGKTGTTNDFEDAWFSGFNSEVVATVWVGFDQPSDLGQHESGSKAALPIWIDFMRTALEDVPESELTALDNIIQMTVDKDSGLAIADDDPNGIKELFIAGTQPLVGQSYASSGTAVVDAGSMQAKDDLF